MENKKVVNLKKVGAKAKMFWYQFLGAIHCLPPLDPRIHIIGQVTDANSARSVAQKATSVLSKQSGRQ